MQPNNLFWQASLDELKQGYVHSQNLDRYICLCCGFQTEPGHIYPEGDGWVDAEKAIRIHLRQKHDSSLNFLLQLDKRWTGLTELQTRLVRLFASGAGDQEIAGILGTGSVSTIRNHHFMLREKQKQAKVFLAIVELMEQQSLQKNRPSERSVDNTLPAETQKILATYFPQGIDGPLSTFPTREKRRLILLKQITTRFLPGRVYNEKEVNAILGAVYNDHVLLRRLLIDYGFLSRRPDGSEYWITSPATEAMEGSHTGEEDEKMMDDRKKELIREYKETPRPMGVFQIKNKVNGKLLLVKAMNIPGIMNGRLMELKQGTHKNRELQADWNQYGESAFSFDVLATLKPEDYLPEEWPGAVAELLKTWLEKIQPYGDAGYNLKK
jgi:hypothetical protein